MTGGPPPGRWVPCETRYRSGVVRPRVPMERKSMTCWKSVLVCVTIALPAVLQSQDSLSAREKRRSLDLMVGDVGLSIGDSRRVKGIRLNFRDTRLDRVDGLNATIWHPDEGGAGDIYGIALGLPS